jgi:quercetin dioxygenase-like cupin family protein
MKSKSMIRYLAIVILAATAAGAVSVWAQESKRTELSRSDLTGTNMEVIVSTLEVPPGASVPRHIHYGEEAAYVLEGATTESPGQPPVVRAAGTSIINKREVPHGGYKVIGDKTLKLLTVHIVDKGKPTMVPVP